jgi:uncharacterized tellurite resistance protein B-like protein
MNQNKRRNKDIAGYEILCILARIDGEFDPREGTVITDYMKENFPLGGNFDFALERLSALDAEDFEKHMLDCATDFYADSTEEERTTFLRFAMNLIRADEKVAKEEDLLITRLFEAWDV